jgi:hypothetical protein
MHMVRVHSCFTEHAKAELCFISEFSLGKKRSLTEEKNRQLILTAINTSRSGKAFVNCSVKVGRWSVYECCRLAGLVFSPP